MANRTGKLKTSPAAETPVNVMINPPIEIVVTPDPVPGIIFETQEPLITLPEPPKKGKSVVPAKYRARYASTGGSCNDDLSHQLKEFVTMMSLEGPKVDLVKFRAFAIANDCWVEKYAGMNPGMQRMNVGNRLRAKVRQPDFKINWDV